MGIFDFWGDMAGQSDLSKIRNYWQEARPDAIDPNTILGNTDFSKFSRGLGMLSNQIQNLNDLRNQDTVGLIRQNIREDVGGTVGAQGQQMNQAFAAGGISPGLAAAAVRANSRNAYSTMGRQLREARIADVAQKAGIAAQAGSLAGNYATLGLDRSKLAAGIRQNVALQNQSVLANWQQNRAVGLSDAYQTNVVNKANRNAGFLSGLMQLGGTIAGAYLTGGTSLIFQGLGQGMGGGIPGSNYTSMSGMG